MSLTRPARQFFFETAPRAAQLGVPGGVLAFAVTTTASYIQLNTLFPQSPATGVTSSVPAQNTSYTSQLAGVCDQFITIEAVTATVGVVTGKQVTDVTTGGSIYNAPNLTVVATLSGGAVTLPAASSGSPGICCAQIFPGTSKRFTVTAFQDLFLGFVGSGDGYMIIYQSSGSDA